MDAEKLINKYYQHNNTAHKYLLLHSNSVRRLAKIAAEINTHMAVDMAFVEEAAMLHDIGIIQCYAPGIGCYGESQYLMHGIKGALMLREEGFFDHALVCERHVGIGISAAEIEEKKLPLPVKDMLPQSHEERIVCIADKFFSKNEQYLVSPKPYDLIFREMSKLGERQQTKFLEWFRFYQFEKALAML